MDTQPVSISDRDPKHSMHHIPHTYIQIVCFGHRNCHMHACPRREWNMFDFNVGRLQKQKSKHNKGT